MHAKHDPLAKETPQAYKIGLETTRELFYRAKSRPGVYHAIKDVPRSRCEREQLQQALRSIDMWLEKLDLYKGFANWLRCDQMVYAQDHFCEGVTHGLDPLASSINRETERTLAIRLDPSYVLPFQTKAGDHTRQLRNAEWMAYSFLRRAALSLQRQKTTSALQDREHMLLCSNRLKKVCDSEDSDHNSGLVRLIRQTN